MPRFCTRELAKAEGVFARAVPMPTQAEVSSLCIWFMTLCVALKEAPALEILSKVIDKLVTF